jgi:hypothetical protein
MRGEHNVATSQPAQRPVSAWEAGIEDGRFKPLRGTEREECGECSTESKGRKISIRTIDLNQHWKGIHDDLLILVDEDVLII